MSLEIITVKDELVCDLCCKKLERGHLAFLKYEEKYDAYLYFCSQHCLDEYEAKEFLDDLHKYGGEY